MAGRKACATKSVQAETDDFAASVHQNIEPPVQVGVEGPALLGVGLGHFSVPSLAALLPRHLLGVGEDSAERTAGLVEIEFQLAVSACGVREGINSTVNRFFFIEGRSTSGSFSEDQLRILDGPLADQFLAK